MSFVSPQNGETILNTHITQFVRVLTGVAGEQILLTGYSSASNYALTLKNAGSGGLALRGLSAAGVETLTLNDTALTITRSEAAAVWDQATTPITTPLAKFRFMNGTTAADEVRLIDDAPYHSSASVSLLIPSTARMGSPLDAPRPAMFSSAFQSILKNQSPAGGSGLLGTAGVPGVAGYFQAQSEGAAVWGINTMTTTTNGQATAAWGIEVNSNILNYNDTYKAIDIIGDTRIGHDVLTNDFTIVTGHTAAYAVRVAPLGFASTAFLNATINAGAGSLVVTRAPTPDYAVPFRALIDSEVVYVTNVAGTTWTITRAQEGTAAASHTAGTTITCPSIGFTHAFYTEDGATASGIRLGTAINDQWLSPSQTITLVSRNAAGSQLSTKLVGWVDGGMLIRAGADTGAFYFQNTAGSDTWMQLQDGRVTFDGGVTASAGISYIGTTTNSKMTQGLSINQGGADDALFSGQSSDVGHGVTDLTDTQTFIDILKATAADGGALIRGYTEATVGLLLSAVSTTADTTQNSTSATGYVVVNTAKKSGTGVTAPSANENLFVVKASNAAQWLVDADGDTKYNGTDGAGAWDDHDDVALLEGVRLLTNPDRAVNYRRRFCADIAAHAEILERTGVVSVGPEGQAWVSTKGLNGLLIDAVRQLAGRIEDVRAELKALAAPS